MSVFRLKIDRRCQISYFWRIFEEKAQKPHNSIKSGINAELYLGGLWVSGLGMAFFNLISPFPPVLIEFLGGALERTTIVKKNINCSENDVERKTEHRKVAMADADRSLIIQTLPCPFLRRKHGDWSQYRERDTNS